MQLINCITQLHDWFGHSRGAVTVDLILCCTHAREARDLLARSPPSAVRPGKKKSGADTKYAAPHLTPPTDAKFAPPPPLPPAAASVKAKLADWQRRSQQELVSRNLFAVTPETRAGNWTYRDRM